uniref:Carbohydrate-binding domain-containing protein n=1 Tax=Neobodo designis TaxID=312471 RepID=A0A7S1MT85_NEODS
MHGGRSFRAARAAAALAFLVLAAPVFAALSTPEDGTCDDATRWSHYPSQTVVYATTQPPTIDGVVNGDPAWDAVPWSAPFVDIATTTPPEFATRIKTRYDAANLYVAAHLVDTAVWANITYCCHCVNASEDQVIFHDNDFEVFVDTRGTTHWYKEFEINAANANWNLLLDRPYSDGGVENSSRVDGASGYDMMHRVPPARTAVSVVHGRLNDPASGPRGWYVELALPLASLAYHTDATVPPREGEYWRANFARVEWGVVVEGNRYLKRPSCQSCADPGSPQPDNWVWSPMHAVNLHAPELWGYLQFANASAVNATAAVRDPQWPQRWAAHNAYVGQRAYFDEHGRYASDVGAIAERAPSPEALANGCIGAVRIELRGRDARGYTAYVEPGPGSNVVITVDERRLTLASNVQP